MVKILSSYKLIKSKYIEDGNEENILELDYNIDYLEENLLDIKEADDLNNISKDINPSLELLTSEELLEERDKILEEAIKEANKIKEEASEEGYEIAYKKGLEEGYLEGIEKSEKEMKEARENALNLIDQAERKVKEYFIENKNNFIKLSIDMAESIINFSIDKDDKQILNLIEPIIIRYNKKEKITLTCHPSRHDFLENNIIKLEELSPDTKFFVLKDENLNKNDCILENEDQLIDLSIKKQLDSILNTIKHME